MYQDSIGSRVRSGLAGLLAAGALFAAGPASAEYVSYTIAFSGTGVTPSGGFEFDDVSNTFRNFVVEWGGVDYDFTGGANAPFRAIGFSACGFNEALKVFKLLTQDSCLQALRLELYATGFSGRQNPVTDESLLAFRVDGLNDSGSFSEPWTIVVTSVRSFPIDGATRINFDGNFIATPTVTTPPGAVPEPGTLALLLAAAWAGWAAGVRRLAAR